MPTLSDTRPSILYRGRDGVDPLTHADVACTRVDFTTTLWSYENCELTQDTPFTVRTRRLGTECFVYAMLKLVPGLYVCTVKSRGPPNCRLEIIQREKDYDGNDANNWKNKVVHRHGCLCGRTTDLKLLITGDTDAEVRIVFDPFQDLRVPSFAVMEVRSRRKIAMPMKLRIQTGLYKPQPMRYGSLDIHRMLKKVHYVLYWLKCLDEHLNAVIQLVSNPLWDVDDPSSAFDYTQEMQHIQNALTTELPHSFVATSFCFSVFLFPGVKVPLMSQTLVKELHVCINQDPVDTTKLLAVFRHSLKYINFMSIEYIEFRDLVTDKLAGLTAEQAERWHVVRVQV